MNSVVDEYMYYLKRFEDAWNYFVSLSEEEILNVSDKVWDEYERVVKKTAQLSMKAREYGCNEIKYYDR